MSMRLQMISVFFALLGVFAAPARAQVPPQLANQSAPPPPTPVNWKWQRLDKDTNFEFVAHKDNPLVLLFPDAPGDGYGGLTGYLARYLFEEGYALGIVSWRGDFARTAAPSAIVARAFADLARVRSIGGGKFDPNRIVMMGGGDGGFLAMLLSDDVQRLQSSGTPPASICATVLFSPTTLDPFNPGSFDARRQFSREPDALAAISPLRYAASSPPVLIMTELRDRADEARGNAAGAVLKAAGKTVVQTIYAPFEEKEERTYLGARDNPATDALGDFLKANCPATSR